MDLCARRKLSKRDACWKAMALVCALVLTSCGKGSGGASTNAASALRRALSYAANPAYYVLNSAITSNTVSSSKAISSYSISPSFPAGLTFSTTTGTISGTPTAQSAAQSYTVTGVNSYGSNFVTLILGADQVGSISYGGSLSFEQGTSVGTVTPTVTGGSVTSCSITPALPAGLSFNTSNCAITGTPTTTVTAPSYTITPSYGSPTSVTGTGISENITITSVAPQITFTGGALSFTEYISVGTVTPIVTNGPVTSCSVSPALPSGLSLNTTNCDITGTPTTTVTNPGGYLFTSSNVHGSSSATIPITISDPVPSISYAPNTENYYYMQSIATVTPTNTGGEITSCAVAPSLPSGLSLNGSCQLSGTPTALSGATSYTITPSGPGGAGSGVTFTITVHDVAPIITFSEARIHSPIIQRSRRSTPRAPAAQPSRVVPLHRLFRQDCLSRPWAELARSLERRRSQALRRVTPSPIELGRSGHSDIGHDQSRGAGSEYRIRRFSVQLHFE